MVHEGDSPQDIEGWPSNDSIVNPKGVYYQEVAQHYRLGWVAPYCYEELNSSVRPYIITRESIEGGVHRL